MTLLYVRADIAYHELKAGGSVAHTLGVINGFLELGHSVVCASSVMHTQLASLPLTSWVRLRNPQIVRFLRWRLNCLLSNLFFLPALLWCVYRYKPEVLYQRYTIFSVVGIWISWLCRIPLTLEYNGSEVWIDTCWGSGKKFWRLRWLAQVCERWNLSYAHTIIVVSQALYDELVQRGIKASKIIVNPNGVDANLYNAGVLVQERATIREQLGIEDTYVFCFVGTFSPWHGITFLASMIPAVIKIRPHAHFLLIGDGPLLPWLQSELAKGEGCEGSVTYTGLLPQEHTRNYLAAADAFLCPTQPNADGSPFFGSPTKLFEYMSMAKPIIASDLEQVAQVLKGIGILVTPGDVQGFVQAAVQCMSLDSHERSMLGQRAREEVIAKYQWKSHVERIIAAKDKSDARVLS